MFKNNSNNKALFFFLKTIHIIYKKEFAIKEKIFFEFIWRIFFLPRIFSGVRPLHKCTKNKFEENPYPFSYPKGVPDNPRIFSGVPDNPRIFSGVRPLHKKYIRRKLYNLYFVLIIFTCIFYLHIIKELTIEI